MTDQELQQAIKEVGERLDKLPESEESLTREERQRRQLLLLEKETLQKIQEAREKRNISKELSHTVTYGLLTSLGEKHPFLMYLLQAKFRWNIF